MEKFIKTYFLKIKEFAGKYSHVNWSLADQAVVSAANFFTSLIVARYLGIEAFGVFSVAWLIVLFVQSLQIALILTPMLSIGPKAEAGQQAGYYGSLQSLQVVFGIVSAIVAALFSAYGGDFVGMGAAGAALALPLALTVVTSQLHEFARRACYARTRPSAALIMDLARYGTQFALFFYLFSAGHGTVANTLYTVAACALLGLVAVARQLSLPSLCPERIRLTAERHWNMSRWLLPSALMQWTSGNFFTLAAGAMLGSSAVGAMRAAHNLIGVINVFFQFLDNWAQVRASRILDQNGLLSLRVFIRKLLFVSGGGTTFAVLIIIVWSEFWLDLFYGKLYVSYSWIMIYFGIAYIAMSFNSVLRYFFIATENTRMIFIAYAFSSISSMAIFYPLINGLGLSGALIGFALSPVSFMLALMLFWNWRLIER